MQPSGSVRFYNLRELEELARPRIPKPAFDFYKGGAEDLASVRENEVAFSRYKLLPRMLVDVSRIDTSTTLLGHKLSMPVLIAPTGLKELAHPDGDLAVASAAQSCGTAMGVSSNSTYSMEEVAATRADKLFFQIYVFRDRDVLEELVHDAERHGYKGLIVTVDCPIAGNREQDAKNKFALPKGMEVKNIRRLAKKLTQQHTGTQGKADQESAYHSMHASVYDQALTWQFIPWLQGVTRLPIILKGILSPADAKIAVDRYQVDGLILSNHGGRQCDYTPAAVDMLEDVLKATQHKVPIMVDGGVRRGSDVVKALALGADAVLIGRPVIFGLALGGQQGVEQVLQMLHGELELTMRLCGVPSIKHITPELVIKPPNMPAASTAAFAKSRL